MASGETQGLVKIIAEKSTDRILGVHILGPQTQDDSSSGNIDGI